MWRLWPIVVGDTKWDHVIKLWCIHSHEWNCQPRAHVVTLIYIKIWTYDTWLIKYTPRLPDILGCFAFNVNFLIVDYFYLRTRYLMKVTVCLMGFLYVTKCGCSSSHRANLVIFLYSVLGNFSYFRGIWFLFNVNNHHTSNGSRCIGIKG